MTMVGAASSSVDCCLGTKAGLDDGANAEERATISEKTRAKDRRDIVIGYFIH